MRGTACTRPAVRLGRHIPNFIGDEDEDRVRAAFGQEKYQRLAVIKARYAPDNVFRGNQNIKPEGRHIRARAAT
jgi:hypothetical protein